MTDTPVRPCALSTRRGPATALTSVEDIRSWLRDTSSAWAPNRPHRPEGTHDESALTPRDSMPELVHTLESPPSSQPTTPSDDDDGPVFTGPRPLTSVKVQAGPARSDYFGHGSAVAGAPQPDRKPFWPAAPPPSSPVALIPLALVTPDPDQAWAIPPVQRQLLPAIQLSAFGHAQSSPPAFRPAASSQSAQSPPRPSAEPLRAEPVVMSSLPMISPTADPLLAPIASGEVDAWSLSDGESGDGESGDADDEDDTIVWPVSAIAGARCTRIAVGGGRHVLIWLYPAARARAVSTCRTIYERSPY